MIFYNNLSDLYEKLKLFIPNEIHIFITLNINSLGTNVYPNYSFFLSEDGIIRGANELKDNFNSKEKAYQTIVNEFLSTHLTFVQDTIIKRNQDYLGICLINTQKEKLNLYYSKDALHLYDEMKKRVEAKKEKDFYEFGKHYIKKQEIKRMVFYPTVDDRSSVMYIYDNEEYNSLRKQRQFRYYYRRSGELIDNSDLEAIFALIRYFVNQNLEEEPIYNYETNYSRLTKEERAKANYKWKTKSLKIECKNGAFIEISDAFLMTEIERARIIDDLWLVMNGVIQEMPLQEESREEKELLLQKKLAYLKGNPTIRKGKA